MIAVSSFEAGFAVWTIRGALVCMVAFFAIRISNPKLDGNDSKLAKTLWLVGSLLSLLHALATMAFHHDFQHQLAYEDTAKQTEQTIGVAVGIGIWFNYLFVTVWLFDSLWLNAITKSYCRRPRILDRLIYGFLGFIAFNGAIVFETGPVRWFGLATVLWLGFVWNSKKNPDKNEERREGGTG